MVSDFMDWSTRSSDNSLSRQLANWSSS